MPQSQAQNRELHGMPAHDTVLVQPVCLCKINPEYRQMLQEAIVFGENHIAAVKGREKVLEEVTVDSRGHSMLSLVLSSCCRVDVLSANAVRYDHEV